MTLLYGHRNVKWTTHYSLGVSMIAQNALIGKKILIIGGNGFIGRHVVQVFAERGAKIRILDRQINNDRTIQAHETITGCSSDPTLVASSVTGCDTVIYLASNSLPGTGNIALADEIRHHVEVAIRTSEICQLAGVRRFIFASSGGAAYGYGGSSPLKETMPTLPLSAYGVSKVTIEQYLRLLSQKGSLTTVSLRISNPYGEWQYAHRGQGIVAAAFEHAFSGHPMTIWGDGSVERDFIYVGDVAKAFEAACLVDARSLVVNIGSGRSCSIINIIKSIEEKLNRKINLEFSQGRSVDVQLNTLDISVARDVLKWKPQTSISEGLSLTAEWWKQIKDC